jgi:hypothetical protein
VHGSELVAELAGDFERFAAQFASWIDRQDNVGS